MIREDFWRKFITHHVSQGWEIIFSELPNIEYHVAFERDITKRKQLEVEPGHKSFFGV